MRPALLALVLVMIALRIAPPLPAPLPPPPPPAGFLIPLREAPLMNACMPSMTALIGGHPGWQLAIRVGFDQTIERTYTIDVYRTKWAAAGGIAHETTTTMGDLSRLIALESLPCKPARRWFRIDYVDDDRVTEGVRIGAETAAGQLIAALLAGFDAHEDATYDDYLSPDVPIALHLSTTTGGHHYELVTAGREIVVVRDGFPVVTTMMTRHELYDVVAYGWREVPQRAPIARGEMVTRRKTLPFLLAHGRETAVLAHALEAAFTARER